MNDIWPSTVNSPVSNKLATTKKRNGVGAAISCFLIGRSSDTIPNSCCLYRKNEDLNQIIINILILLGLDSFISTSNYGLYM